MRFLKIILVVSLSLITLLSVLGLIVGASEGKADSFYYGFYIVIGAGSFSGVYFLVKNIQKNKRNAIPEIVSAQQPSLVHSPEAICGTSGNASTSSLKHSISGDTQGAKQSPVETIAKIISCENDEAISLEMVAQKMHMPPASLGKYLSSIFFDVLNEVTAAHPIVSERQEKTLRELAAVCGAVLSEDVENQLKKMATIRDIVSFKADPREFVRKSLLVE